MSKEKRFANKGVRRNKKPLQNIIYKVEPNQILRSDISKEQLEIFKEKYFLNDKVGFVRISWKLHKENENVWNWSSKMTLAVLKERLSQKQWSKLCQGRAFEFTVQRRINKKNV